MRLIQILVICLLCTLLHAQTVDIHTHESLELFNTVWVLANGSSDSATNRRVYERFGEYSHHPSVEMLKKQGSNSVVNYCENFEYLALPYLALQLTEQKNNDISYDAKKLDNDKLIIAYWKKGK